MDLVSLVDLPATLLSLAGRDVPRWMRGSPFMSPEHEHHEYVFSTRDRYDEECPGERYRTSKETRRSSLSP